MRFKAGSEFQEVAVFAFHFQEKHKYSYTWQSCDSRSFQKKYESKREKDLFGTLYKELMMR
jgi:hypothetical protein